MAITSQTDFFLDFGRYGDLKRGARSRSDEAALAVARQFEGLMLQQMLASMRSSIVTDEANQSSFGEFYQEMYDKQLAQVMANNGGLGLARLIRNNAPGLTGDDGSPEAAASLADKTSLKLPEQVVAVKPLAMLQVQQQIRALPQAPAAGVASVDPDLNVDHQGASSDEVVTRPYIDNDFAEQAGIEAQNQRWSKPLTFVSDIWPHALQAANQLGIKPGLLVAQAALETGWGQHMMKFSDGRNGFNLFGIKAGNSWQGAVLARPSLEYRDGVMRSEVSRFRAYSSPGDSFSDYVSFIQNNGRYRNALAAAKSGNDEGYIRGIHAAGYATDPQYAEKILNISRGQTLKQFLTAGVAAETGVNSNA